MTRTLPVTTSTIHAVGRDGIYQAGSVEGLTVRGVKITLADGVNAAGNPTYARAGIITDMDSPHRGYVLQSVIVHAQGDNHSDWGIRRHRLFGPCLTQTVHVSNIGRGDGHAIYDELHAGKHTYEDLVLQNCAANALQTRLKDNRSDSHWADQRELVVDGLQSIECGQLRGAGRAGFAVSIKDSGPATSVLLRRMLVQSVKQRRVAKKSDGTFADSFGGVCVEFCARLELDSCIVDYFNPYSEAVQLFDFSNKAARNTGPASFLVRNVDVRRGRNINIRAGDGPGPYRIDGCKGTGKIQVFEYTGGTWRKTKSLPITGGYSA